MSTPRHASTESNEPTEGESTEEERTVEERTETDGQVSEVSRMDPDDAGTPVAAEDATAGYPDSESGEPDEGAAGPEASQPENRRDSQV